MKCLLWSRWSFDVAQIVPDHIGPASSICHAPLQVSKNVHALLVEKM